MSHYYRCNKCRALNTWKHPLEWYLRTRKCKKCGWSRFYVDKQKTTRTDYCRCEGYHYTHREGSPYCIKRPDYELNVRVGRYGEKLEDVKFDIAWNNPVPCLDTEEVPF